MLYPVLIKSAFPGIQLPYESKKDCVLFLLEFCQESFTSLKNHTTDCLIALGICVSETIHVNRFICTHQSPMVLANICYVFECSCAQAYTCRNIHFIPYYLHFFLLQLKYYFGFLKTMSVDTLSTAFVAR